MIESVNRGIDLPVLTSLTNQYGRSFENVHCLKLESYNNWRNEFGRCSKSRKCQSAPFFQEGYIQNDITYFLFPVSGYR